MPQSNVKIDLHPSSKMTLKLEHWAEDLSPAQRIHYNRAEKEFLDVTSRIHDLVKNKQADVLEAGDEVMLLQVNGTSL